MRAYHTKIPVQLSTEMQGFSANINANPPTPTHQPLKIQSVILQRQKKTTSKIRSILIACRISYKMTATVYTDYTTQARYLT